MTVRSEALVDTLATQLHPLGSRAIERRLALGLGAGAAVTAVMIAIGLGVRPDFAEALHEHSIWMKWTYTLSLGLVAIVATRQLSRPETRRSEWLWLAIIPILLLTGIAAGELVATPLDDRMTVWLGGSSRECSLRVLTLSLPIFAALLWSVRQLAPTRLRLAGAVVGLAAGGFAATLYGVACPETSAMFVLTWYSLGIAAPVLLGALIGPRVLRW